MLYIFIIIAIGICLYVSLGPKLSNMKEGIWEISMNAKIPGAQTRQPVKKSQILKKDAPVPQFSIPGYECRLMRTRYPYHIVGNFVLYKIQCKGSSIIQGKAHIKYSGDTLKGSIKMRTIDGKGKEQKGFNISVSGIYTGEG